MELRLSWAAFILVLATYLFLGLMGLTDRENPHPRDAAYNLLARGLLSGHLYVDKAVPAGLTQLADPYDPVANKPFRIDTVNRLHDLSYYRGRLYLYFGVAPALLVFIPWHLLTGGWLPHWVAAVLICAAGLLVNLSLIRSIKARQFPRAPAWILAVATLTIGLASYAPILLARADVWEIPIAFSYFALSLAIRLLWVAFCRPDQATLPIALASVALGAAFASRPNVLPAWAILCLPFVAPATRRNGWNWLAAILPAALCGGAVAAYNAERFGDPFEFGQRYQLAAQFVAKLKPFSGAYLLPNIRLDLFQPVVWSAIFPFAHEPVEGVLRPNAGGVEHISGVLLNAPILWAALLVPCYVVVRRPSRAFTLIAASAAWAGLTALTLLLFFAGANSRYQFEYTPEMALLAAVGIMAVESPSARMPRILLRWIWIPALALSAAFPVLYGIDRCAQDHNLGGFDCLSRGDIRGAGREFDTARLLSPGSPFSRLVVGVMLAARGQTPEALAAFQALVRDFPTFAMGHFDLAHQLEAAGREDEALTHYEIACRLAPDDAAMKAAWQAALGKRGKP